MSASRFRHNNIHTRIHGSLGFVVLFRVVVQHMSIHSNIERNQCLGLLSHFFSVSLTCLIHVGIGRCRMLNKGLCPACLYGATAHLVMLKGPS